MPELSMSQWLTFIGLAIAGAGLLYSKRRYDLMQIDMKDKRKDADRQYRRKVAATFAKHKREMQALSDQAEAYKKKYELLHNHVKTLDDRVYANKK